MNQITPKQPTFKLAKDLPEPIMALIINMWDRELGKIPDDISRIMFTYHESIYTNQKISEDYFIHEMAHYVRQGAGENKEMADKWWYEYCTKPDFRYQEELLAYREQYHFMQGRLNKPQAFEYAKFLAKELSSEKYGKLYSFNKALASIIEK